MKYVANERPVGAENRRGDDDIHRDDIGLQLAGVELLDAHTRRLLLPRSERSQGDEVGRVKDHLLRTVGRRRLNGTGVVVLQHGHRVIHVVQCDGNRGRLHAVDPSLAETTINRFARWHSFMQRPVHPSFGWVKVVDG